MPVEDDCLNDIILLKFNQRTIATNFYQEIVDNCWENEEIGIEKVKNMNSTESLFWADALLQINDLFGLEMRALERDQASIYHLVSCPVMKKSNHESNQVYKIPKTFIPHNWTYSICWIHKTVPSKDVERTSIICDCRIELRVRGNFVQINDWEINVKISD